MIRYRATIFAVVLGWAAAGSAFAAQPAPYSRDAQTLCQPDMFRLCNDAVPDEDQIVACMKANRKQLSPECRKAFDAELKQRK